MQSMLRLENNIEAIICYIAMPKGVFVVLLQRTLHIKV